MKRFATVLFLLSTFVPLGFGAPIEFFAQVTSKTVNDSGVTILGVTVTPAFTLEVAVTSVTELKNELNEPITIDDVQVEDFVTVEALATSAGFLALEIKLEDPGDILEVKGYLQAVDHDPNRVEVQNLELLVTEATEIRDELKNRISFADLEERFDAAEEEGDALFVRVEGYPSGDSLTAASIRIVPVERSARINLTGVILSFTPSNQNQFLLDLGGGIHVLVNITGETRIVGGELVPGATAQVQGFVGPDLSVIAWRIRVVQSFEVSPDHLRMIVGKTHTVTILLRDPLDRDVSFRISSQDETVATASPIEIVIPQGAVSGVFEVTGVSTGSTEVDVTGDDSLGGSTQSVGVRVGDDPSGTPELELEWNPPVIEAAPLGETVARLMLKHGVAPEALRIPLTLERASPDLRVEFPAAVEFPAGERVVAVRIKFLSRTGSGLIVAALPEASGGDTAALRIDLKPVAATPLRLEWSARSIDVEKGQEFTVRVVLSRPAPASLRLSISPVGNDRSVLESYPASVEIVEGAAGVAVPFKAGTHSGRMKIRAAVAREHGGAADDLEIRVH